MFSGKTFQICFYCVATLWNRKARNEPKIIEEEYLLLLLKSFYKNSQNSASRFEHNFIVRRPKHNCADVCRYYKMKWNNNKKHMEEREREKLFESERKVLRGS